MATFSHPVEVYRNAEGDWMSTGISFEDLTGVQTYKRNPTPRKLPTPPWAFPGAAQRALLVRFMECRAALKSPQPGTERERLVRAQQRLIANRSRLEATLDSLMTAWREGPPYRGRDTDGRFISKRRLEAEIQGIDSQLCTLGRGDAGVIARIIFLFYGCRFDSVAVATEVRMRPPAVRQVLNRLHAVWERMQAEATHGPAECQRVR